MRITSSFAGANIAHITWLYLIINLFNAMFFDALKKELEIRNFSPKTVRAYLFYNSDLIRYCQKDPAAVKEQDIKGYLWHLLEERKVSASTARLAINAIKFYYRNVKRRKFQFYCRLPKGDKKLPVVFSKSEINKLLSWVGNFKQRLILALMYSAGLRVSKAVKLRACDLDLENKKLAVRQGKGNKDRISVISEKMINDLHWLISQKQKMAKFRRASD